MENRFTKYLAYALGEIILVVIGILIALQLNNLNSQNQRNQKEHTLLKEMKSNLLADLEDCRWNIDFQNRSKLANSTVLDHLNSNRPFHDSLGIHYGCILGGTFLTINTSAFDNLKSIGFDLIRNDNLRREITDLYSQRYRYLQFVETTADSGIQNNQVIPQISAKVITEEFFKYGYPVDLEKLRMDDEFKGMLRINLLFRDYMISKYKETQNQIESLIGLINSELGEE